MLVCSVTVTVCIRVGSSRDDLDDHFRRLQPIDLNLDLLGTTHLDHESRVYHFIHKGISFFYWLLSDNF